VLDVRQSSVNAAMFSPFSLPRQMPEKLTTAPMSVRPFVSAAISRAMSKSSCWMRMVTLAVIGRL